MTQSTAGCLGSCYQLLSSLDSHSQNVVQCMQERLKNLSVVDKRNWADASALKFKSGLTELAYQQHEAGW